MRISDWSSDVCSSDLHEQLRVVLETAGLFARSGGAHERDGPCLQVRAACDRGVLVPDAVDALPLLGADAWHVAAQAEAPGTEAHSAVSQGVASHADATGDPLRCTPVVRRLAPLDGARRQSGASDIPAVHIPLLVASVP